MIRLALLAKKREKKEESSDWVRGFWEGNSAAYIVGARAMGRLLRSFHDCKRNA